MTTRYNTPKRAWGRVVASIVIVLGLIWYADFQSSLASAKTIIAQEHVGIDINDLSGEKIGYLAGTTSEDYLSTLSNITPVSCNGIEEGAKKLENEEIFGLVYDYPVVKRIADKSEDIALAGDIIKVERYGFFCNVENDKCREAINRVILKIQEDGRYDAIYNKWFKK